MSHLLPATGLAEPSVPASPPVPNGRRARPARLAAALAMTAALVACGGGSSQVEPFQADRVIAFGDESSLITPAGRKYGVNAFTSSTDKTIDCRLEPIWSQAVANQYGFSFAECPAANATEFKAVMRAAEGATVADLTAQVTQASADGLISDRTMTTVLVGARDILDLYAQYPARDEASLVGEARTLGERAAGQVNRLTELGARVIVSTVPDLGLSPFALKEKADPAKQDTDRAALIGRLTAAFNGRLRVNILNDGRLIGLVLGDELTQAIARVPDAFGMRSVTTGVCTTALPDCTPDTLVANGTSSNHLWADDTRLAYGGQFRLGSQAVARAADNPF